ncbi:hypothetical protein GCM10027417_12360 [Glutamicibacter endophyticus]
MSTESHAADHYEARLEQSHEAPLRAAGRWVAAIASAALGANEIEPIGAAVVVHSRADNSVILTLKTSNIEEAERLIESVRKDLEELTDEEFMDEWGAKAAEDPA